MTNITPISGRCKPRSISRPFPVVGRCYRNGAGQVRRFLALDGLTVEFEVQFPGPAASFTSQYPAGFRGRMLLESFRQWLVAECDPAGTPIHIPGLRRPRAKTKHLLAILAKILRGAA